MKKFEALIGTLFGIAFASLAFLAIFVVSAFIYRVPAQSTEPAYVVATTEGVPASNAKATVATTPTQTAAVDVAAGEQTFKACKVCHSAEKGGKPGTGPNLWSVVGRNRGSVEGFAYSDGLKAMTGDVWDVAALDAFLTKPKDYIKATKMAYAGLKKPEDRANLIAWLASQSDTPLSPDQLGFAAAATTATPTADATAADTPVVLDEIPMAEGVVYADPPAKTDAQVADIAAKLASLEAEIPKLDYQRARYHPLHFPPAIDAASSEECLACHQEILSHTPRETSPAGVIAAQSMAWYQTLDTYSGGQADFHWRHLQSDLAKQVMNLECNFCHKGNDPREENPDMMPGRVAFGADATPEFTLRKMVNPSETCLLCHGQMPNPEVIMGLGGKWPDIRADLETPEVPNGCMSCHAETFRTNRHQVTYLKAEGIEALARSGSGDACYGCHGGRAWYRNSYPYARHPWPLMDATVTPEWAANRPATSKPEYQLAPAEQ